MHWLSRLNAAPFVGDGAEVYHWNYAAHLDDNAPHRHTFFEVCLVGAHGHGLFLVEAEEMAIGSGDLFIARPGVVHRIRNRGAQGMELFWVSFSWSDNASATFKAASESDNENAPLHLLRALAQSNVVIARDDGLLAELWHALRAVASGPQHAGKNTQLVALQRAVLMQIAALGAGTIAPDAPLPAPAPHRLARLGARYMHDNLARKLSIAEIAAHLHLSPRHFGRLFAEFAAVSPATYIETARLDRARHLLRHSDQPIKAIAASVGLPDVHHFTRVFSKRCGISPAAYRAGSKRAGSEGASSEGASSEGASSESDVRIIHKEGALV